MSNNPDLVIRRNGRLAAVVGVLAAALAVAFGVRHHGAVDLVLAVLMAGVAVWQLWILWDARTPLLVADRQGVRLRLGRTWSGLVWPQLEEVEHAPASGWWRDGRLVLLPHDPDAALATLTGGALRQTKLSSRLYGAPFALPLGLVTSVAGGRHDLSARLADLAGEVTTIVEIDPGLDDLAEHIEVAGEPDPFTAPVNDAITDTITDTAEHTTVVEAAEPTETDPITELFVIASPTPAPLREPQSAVRAEVTRMLPREVPAAREPEPAAFEEPEEIPDPTPSILPVIGPVLAHARTNIGLSVDQLAERTRIRPHIIEAIEVDDFRPCGGDFYARGHLRTLARVLGVDAVPLLADYDELYADAPIDPRQVFEAELATTSTFRRMKGGPNWSVLIAAVMGVVLIWSVARLVLDAGSGAPTPAVSLSGDTQNPYSKSAPAVPVTVRAAGGGTHIVVRDGSGAVIYTGDLAFGQSKTLKASPPIRVQASDGSATVSVNGGGASAVGETGQVAQKTYTAH